MPHRGGGSGGDGGDGSGPLAGPFLAVMAGLFTEVSSRCSLFVPSPPTPPLRYCPQSPLFSQTAARVLRSFLGTPVLSSMASFPGIASTTDSSRVRGSGILCFVTESVCRYFGMGTWTSICTVNKTGVRRSTNVAVVLGLPYDLMPFNRMQERNEIMLNRVGALMLGRRVRFKKFRAGNFIRVIRVPHNDACPQPPAMVAAMMRPGPPSSMNVNDFHNSLGHANVKALYETAKQMGIKLTGIQEYFDGCAAAKVINRTVPKIVDFSCK